MTLILRLARADDEPALTRLIEQSLRTLGAGDYSAPQLDGVLAHLCRVDRQMIAEGRLYAVTAEERLLGCGGWLPEPDRRQAWLRLFFVHPAAIRRGIGSRLLRVCEGAALTAGGQRLDVLATPQGARLYSAFHFDPVGPVSVRLGAGGELPLLRLSKMLTVPALPAPGTLRLWC